MARQANRYISVRELHFYLHSDASYGPNSTFTQDALKEIYRKNTNHILYRNFHSNYLLKSYKSDHIRHLISLWFGFLGLTAYKDEKPVLIKSDELINLVRDMFNYYFDEGEFKSFLVQNNFPLPVAYFPPEQKIPTPRLRQDKNNYQMSDEQFEQYLRSIKPVYTKSMNEQLSRIQAELDEIEEEHKQLNIVSHRQPPAGAQDQLTRDNESARQNAITNHSIELNSEIPGIYKRKQLIHILAEKQGVREEWLRIKGMDRNKIDDIQKQAEILNVLDNRCLQLQEACRLMKSSDISEGYSISYGEVSDLRGSWESATDAVSLSAGIDNELQRLEDPEFITTEKQFLNHSQHPLHAFRLMDNLRFDEIKIQIDPERLMIGVSARKHKEKISFSDLSMMVKNGVTLNKQGEVFLAMANGTFNSESPGTVNAVNRLSTIFRAAFYTKDSPFIKLKPKFKLIIPKDRREKLKAEKRKTVFNDKLKYPNYSSANEFLKEHDPEFDPEDETYSEEMD